MKSHRENGHPKTQTMQTEYFFSNIWLTFFASNDEIVFNMSYNVCYLFTGGKNSASDCWITRLINFLMEIPFIGPKYTNIKHKNKLPYILGANCVNFWRVCGFIYFVNLLLLFLFFVFSIFLVFVLLLTDS